MTSCSISRCVVLLGAGGGYALFAFAVFNFTVLI